MTTDTVPDSRTALVFAHFHTQGSLRKDTWGFLSACTAAGLPVQFISTNLNDRARACIPAGVSTTCRANEGYDFYSYRQGIFQHFGFRPDELDQLDYDTWHQRVQSSSTTQLSLINSSFLIAEPEKIIRLIQKKISSDVHGLTQNSEISPHIQSYLLIFNRRAIESRDFYDWWHGMKPIDNREDVIRTYEIGLSSWFRKKGFHFSCQYQPSIQDIVESCRENRTPGKKLNLKPLFKHRRVNPTMYFWQALWRSFSIAKIELIEKNPHRFDIAQLTKLPQMALLLPVENDKRP